MAKCKYLLKLPSGDVIELSTSFNNLDGQNPKIDELFNSYNAEENVEKKDKILAKLADLITEETSFKIHQTVLKNIIKKSSEIDNLYQTVNKLIIESGTYANIEQAIKNYIWEGTKKGEVNEKVKSLKAKLLKKRDLNYFKGLGVVGVLGTTTLKEEKDRIKSKNLENLQNYFNTEITENLQLLLSTLNVKHFKNNDSHLLYSVNDSFIGKAWSTDDVVIYETDDDLSLFLGLFKREATKVNIESLVSILKEDKTFDINTFDIQTFFRGTIVENKIIPSTFEKMLTKATDAKTVSQINQILTLVAKTINPDTVGLIKAIKSLFWQLHPNSYGKDNLFKQLQDIQFVENELQVEKEFKERQLSFFELETTNKNMYFAPSETIFDNLYENALENIIVNKDIVKFPEGSEGTYGLVTGIYKRPNNQVAIYGVIKNSFGEIKYVNNTFKAGELTFRKREEPIAEYRIGESGQSVLKLEGAHIKLDTPLSHKIIKPFLSKGDTVGNDLLLGIYPGQLTVEKTSGKVTKSEHIYYSKIRSFTSYKLLELIKAEERSKTDNYKSFAEVNNSNDLTAGDLFLYQGKTHKFYKSILFVDANNVYSYVEDVKKNHYIIKAFPKEGLQGIRNSIRHLTDTDIRQIKKESENLGRSAATMSSFQDSTLAQEGDFFTFTDNGKKRFGEVLSDKKILTYDENLSDRVIKSMDYIKENKSDLQFFTNRNITSNYTLFTTRANSWKVEFKEAIEDSKWEVEVRYVIPKTLSEEARASASILPGNYLNIGQYKDINHINSDDLDFTKELLKVLNQKSNSKIFVRREALQGQESNLYERNLTSLVVIPGFAKLDFQTKSDLNIIQPGTYFALQHKTNKDWIDRNIYRIISVDGDIVKAHLNKFSPEGKIITHEITLSAEELLKERIAKLYLQVGNTKIKPAFKEANKLVENKVENRTKTNKAINLLIDSFKQYTKDLNIPIKLISHSSIFTEGQHAAISSIDENGEQNLSILISDKIGTTEDVIHEFLHVFLIPLRYKHPEIYNDFIKSVLQDSTLNLTDIDSINVTEAEEIFVKFVSAKIANKEDFIKNFENLQTFVNGLKSIITDVNPLYEIDNTENPVELLNTPLMDLFDIPKGDSSHALYNLSLIVTEPAMRTWLNENNITLNCS